MILNNTSFNKQCPFYKTNKYEDGKDNDRNIDMCEAPESRQDA